MCSPYDLAAEATLVCDSDGTLNKSQKNWSHGRLAARHRRHCRCHCFQAIDDNLYPLIMFDANDPDPPHRCELWGADILEIGVVAMGGIITGAHGMAVEKPSSIYVQYPSEENAQMFGVRAAFDSKDMLKPGKPIPTLNRCAGYGKMLVRRGEISHPDLPRFKTLTHRTP